MTQPTFVKPITACIKLICLPLLIFSTLPALANTDEFNGGAFLLTDGHEKHEAAQVSTDVDFEVTGLTAKVTVIQTFHNHTESWLEGTYAFALPENSAVNYMAMHIGERFIEAEIKEKKDAIRIYTQAKSQGKKAALTVQNRPNLFTQKIANIPPHESIKVELRYIQNIRYDLGQFSIRLPLSITPRYHPASATEKNESRMTNLALLEQISNSDSLPIEPISITPSSATSSSTTAPPTTPSAITPSTTIPSAITPSPLRIKGILHAGVDIDKLNSLNHNIDIKHLPDNSYAFELNDSNRNNKNHNSGDTNNNSGNNNQDFVLQWQRINASQPEAAVFHEQMNNSSYLQLMLLPPKPESIRGTIDRELILIVDTSGSMQGKPIEQAKHSVIAALKELSPQDSFNIIEFNSSYSKFSGTQVDANSFNIKNATTWVSQLQANGGTEMRPALFAALSTPDNDKLRQIVFITDGAVSNEQALFKLIHQQLNNARLFTVGIGAAPNSFFMRKAAKFGRGSFTYINNSENVEKPMLELFKKLNSAAITDIDIHWPAGIQVDSHPLNIPDLYFGEPLMINAKVERAIHFPEPVTLTGMNGTEAWTQTLIIPVTNQHFNTTQSNQRSALASIWARKSIDHLLDSKITGVPEKTIKPEVINLALEHQLMSPYTSFVAVEKQISRPQDETAKRHNIPSAKPNNLARQYHQLPQTATSLQQNILLGCVCLFLFFALRIRLT